MHFWLEQHKTLIQKYIVYKTRDFAFVRVASKRSKLTMAREKRTTTLGDLSILHIYDRLL